MVIGSNVRFSTEKLEKLTGWFLISEVLRCMGNSPLERNLNNYASESKRAGRVGCAGSARIGAADQERSRDGLGHSGHGARSHATQQSRDGRFHVEARQLRQVLCASQAGDFSEDWVLGRDHHDEGQTEDYVR